MDWARFTVAVGTQPTRGTVVPPLPTMNEERTFPLDVAAIRAWSCACDVARGVTRDTCTSVELRLRRGTWRIVIVIVIVL